jgi:tetratricopeptide (TPR) repeat protein
MLKLLQMPTYIKGEQITMRNDQAIKKAVRAHVEGKIEEAESLYRVILRSYPLNPDANHNLGLILASRSENSAALILFKAALEVNAGVEQFWISYIDMLIVEKNFNEAKIKIEQIEKIKFSENKSVGIERLLGWKKSIYANKYALEGDYRVSTNKLGPEHEKFKLSQNHHSPASNPSQSEIQNILSSYQSHNFAKTKDLATSMSLRFPEHQFAWKVLGALFGQTGNFEESLVANQKSVEISPNDYEAHNNLGRTLQELGFLTDAKLSYDLAIQLNPDYAEAYNNLGNTLSKLNRLEDAKKSYRKAIDLDASYADPYYNLGNIYTECGHLDSAEKFYLHALDLKSGFVEAHTNLANVQIKVGKLAEAEANYRQAIASATHYSEAHVNLGNLLFETGRASDAEASYQQAILENPNCSHAHYSLGSLFKEMERFDEAKNSFMRAISIQPNSIDAHKSLLICSYLMGDRNLFFDQLDFLKERNQVNPVVGSLIQRSSMRYSIKMKNPFCMEPLEYVSHTSIRNNQFFKTFFSSASQSFLSQISRHTRRQPLLKEGDQTFGNLFDSDNSVLKDLERGIRGEIRKYRRNFVDSKEGFLMKWPEKYVLYGWLIKMRSGGELKPHIHENGWLSGSIYINVPPNLVDGSGALVVSLGEEGDVSSPDLNLHKIINVATNSLVLFPSSLTHYTLPFDSTEDRVVLAFDVIPT